jgi:hypothetical protein
MATFISYQLPASSDQLSADGGQRARFVTSLDAFAALSSRLAAVVVKHPG